MSLNSDSLKRLRPEFDAEKGTFLLTLRCEMEWDKPAFAKLLAAMLEVVLRHDKDETIPRWVAEGFWYLNEFIPNWSSHPDFPREFEDDYYDHAYAVVHDLSEFFFMGHTTNQAMKAGLSQQVAKVSSE